MAENHFIIGLGGTGGKIIRSLRKTIFQTLRTDEPEHANVRYLYMDSDDSMMALDDPTWKILGHSVQLGRASQLVIYGHDLKATLKTLINTPVSNPGLVIERSGVTFSSRLMVPRRTVDRSAGSGDSCLPAK